MLVCFSLRIIILLLRFIEQIVFGNKFIVTPTHTHTKHRQLNQAAQALLSPILNIFKVSTSSFAQYLTTFMVTNKQTKNLFPHKKSEFPVLQLSCHCVLPGGSHLFSPYVPLRCLSGQEDFPLTFLFTRLNNRLVSTSPMPHAPTLELLWWPSASVLHWGA